MTCQFCGKLFAADYRSRRIQKYCSLSCAARAKSPRVTLTCAQCGTSFDRPPSDTGRSKSNLSFCSRACKTAAQRIGGLAEIQPSHYGSVTVNYRVAAFRAYGARCVQCSYSSNARMLDVDHIDNDRRNNELNNLQVLCVWCHAIKTRGVAVHSWDGELAQ
jgi:5-methylcytosine-specific restriction endonuclease McrA